MLRDQLATLYPIPIVSTPTVNNVSDDIVSSPTVNGVADEDECAINDGAQCHDQLAKKATADLTVTALEEHHICQSESLLRAT